VRGFDKKILYPQNFPKENAENFFFQFGTIDTIKKNFNELKNQNIINLSKSIIHHLFENKSPSISKEGASYIIQDMI